MCQRSKFQTDPTDLGIPRQSAKAARGGERVFFSPGERLYVQGPGRGGGAGGGRYGRGTLWRLERIDGRFDMVHTPGGEERHSHLMCER